MSLASGLRLLADYSLTTGRATTIARVAGKVLWFGAGLLLQGNTIGAPILRKPPPPPSFLGNGVAPTPADLCIFNNGSTG